MANRVQPKSTKRAPSMPGERKASGKPKRPDPTAGPKQAWWYLVSKRPGEVERLLKLVQDLALALGVLTPPRLDNGQRRTLARLLREAMPLLTLTDSETLSGLIERYSVPSTSGRPQDKCKPFARNMLLQAAMELDPMVKLRLLIRITSPSRGVAKRNSILREMNGVSNRVRSLQPL